MVRIKAERRTSGGGWISWLFILLLAALVIFFIFWFGEDMETEDVGGVTSEDTTVQEDTAIGDEPSGIEGATDTQGGLVTSFDTLTTQNNADALVGRRVDLDSLRVTDVYNDSTFLVTAQEGNVTETATTPPDTTTVPADTTVAGEILVVYRGPESAGDIEGTDQEMEETEEVLSQGEMVSVRGTIENMSDLDLVQLGISQMEAQEISRQPIYLRAQYRTSLP